MALKKQMLQIKKIKQDAEQEIAAFIQGKTKQVEEETGLTICSVSVYGVHRLDLKGDKSFLVSDVIINSEI